jgi:2-phospho-L-lactate guanylyltransferase
MDAGANALTGSGRCVAVVPLKALRLAKGRLEGHLGAAHRRALTGWMLARVLEACERARAVDDVLVVAGDDDAAALARRLGARVVVEARPTLAAALGTSDILVAHAAACLVVTADLPLATGRTLDELFAASGRGPVVVVAESVDGGTSALLRRPPSVIGTSFGPASAEAHVRLAKLAGIRAVRLHIQDLALDVDDAPALRTAAARLPALAAWLDDRGLGPRAAAS